MSTGLLKILHLEDNPNDVELVRIMLSREGLHPELVWAKSRDEFLDALERGGFDLVLMDYKIPSFDGLTALRAVKEKYPETPVIVVSGTIDSQLALELVSQGATDYVLKDRLGRLAFSIRRALHEAHVLVELKSREKRLIESRDAFFNMLKETDFLYKEAKELYESLVEAFANTIDAKSPWTKGHSTRVSHYAIKIAKTMDLKSRDIETLKIAGLLHDIGKIGTYDLILDKPDRLTAEEFEIVKKHPAHGEKILRPIKHLKDLLPLIRHHHERIDGKGYPDGLTGEKIPMGARILHVADSYDSMTADRPYRPAPGRAYAISEFEKFRGRQFDSQVVDAFLMVLEKI